jgi:hypothetical protein
MNARRSTWKFCDRTILLSALVLLCVSACGGSDDPAPAAVPPPPPPPPSGIGAAGGTVTGPNGSTIVVPANALTQNTAIAIAAASAGAPALPANTQPAGEIYAFTPHGTSFAVPATVTVPFDSARVPTGRSVSLIKTNAAQTAWEAVAGATVAGNAMTAQTSSLSWWLVTLAPTAPTITTQPASITVDAGRPATFSVVAQDNGAAVTYQWRRDGVDIAGATSASYTLTSTTLADNAATFDVVVQNLLGSVTSSAATLTVLTPTGWQPVGDQVNVVSATARSVRQPSVAVAPNGTIFVAYIEHNSDPAGTTSVPEGSLRVRRLPVGATTWTDVGGILNSGAHPQPWYPEIRVRSSDNQPVVAWVSFRNVAGSNRDQMIVQQFNGTAWQPLGTEAGGLAVSAQGDGGIRLVLQAGTDVPHVVFVEGICLVYRTWNGTAWEPDTSTTLGQQRYCAASRQSGAALGISGAGTVYVAGSPPPPPPSADLRNWISVRFRGTNDNGFFNSQVGGGPVNPAPLAEIFDAELAFSLTGQPVLAYAFRNPANALAVREFMPGGWVSVGGDLLTSDPMMTDTLVPTSRVRIESVGGVYGVAWATGTLAQTRVTGRVWNGSAWERVPAPHASGANIGYFGLAVSSGGAPYVALTERSSNQTNRDLAASLFVRTCADWCR